MRRLNNEIWGCDKKGRTAPGARASTSYRLTSHWVGSLIANWQRTPHSKKSRGAARGFSEEALFVYTHLRLVRALMASLAPVWYHVLLQAGSIKLVLLRPIAYLWACLHCFSWMIGREFILMCLFQVSNKNNTKLSATLLPVHLARNFTSEEIRQSMLCRC